MLTRPFLIIWMPQCLKILMVRFYARLINDVRRKSWVKWCITMRLIACWRKIMHHICLMVPMSSPGFYALASGILCLFYGVNNKWWRIMLCFLCRMFKSLVMHSILIGNSKWEFSLRWKFLEWEEKRHKYGHDIRKVPKYCRIAKICQISWNLQNIAVF